MFCDFYPGANKYMWIQPSLCLIDLLISWQLTMYLVIMLFRHGDCIISNCLNDNEFIKLAARSSSSPLKWSLFSLLSCLIYVNESKGPSFTSFLPTPHLFSWSLSRWKKTSMFSACIIYLTLSKAQRFRFYNLIQKHKLKVTRFQSTSVKLKPVLYHWVFQDILNYKSNVVKIKTLSIRELSSFQAYIIPESLIMRPTLYI